MDELDRRIEIARLQMQTRMDCLHLAREILSDRDIEQTIDAAKLLYGWVDESMAVKDG